jgi:aspartate/methionine/tyrosine aminotransferase
VEFKYIQKTPLWAAFSKLGQRIFVPDGIFYWSGRAKKESKINATIGTAYGTQGDLCGTDDPTWTILYVKKVAEKFNIPPNEISEYAPIGGIPELRQAWKEWVVYKCQKGANIDVKPYLTSPLITVGVTEGLSMASALFMDPGDHIILPDKFWENYSQIFDVIGQGKIQYFPFFAKGDFNLDGMVSAVKKSLQAKGKTVLLLNFPNNPTGYVPSPAMYKKIADRLSAIGDEMKKPIVVLCDDAYEGYTYDEKAATYSLFPHLVNRSPFVIPIKLDGASKEMLMYGGRVGAFTLGVHPGWVPAEARAALDAEINNKLEGYIRGTISNSNRAAQYIIAQLLIKDRDELLKQRACSVGLLTKRYKLINKLLTETPLPNASVDPNNGGFFLLINVKGAKASDIADKLLKQEQVAVIPIEAPEAGVNAIRVAYCSVKEADMPKLVAAIRNVLPK